MKKLILIIIFPCITGVLFSQALFTYGTNAVNKEEFLRAYNKNKTTTTDKAKALREYLDLYIKFKLKVKAAQDLSFDTLASLKSDLQNFRGQIEESYMDDKEQVNALVDEAFQRSQKDIHVAYLFVPIGKPNDPADTMKSYKAMMDQYKEIISENKSFGLVAALLVKQDIAATSDDLGFITALSIPYEFENIVYAMKPGQVSKPYRSKSGFHIFKVIEERKAVGKMKAAQIMIALPAEATNSVQESAFKLADSLYKLLKRGADFSDLAKANSNDKMTYMSGGLIPEFGTGKFDPTFEEKVFALQKDGNITPPFKTDYGFHIVKRLGRTPVPSNKNDATFMYALKQQVEQNDRISIAKAKFLKQVLLKTGYQNNPSINKSDLYRLTDSFTISNKKKQVGALNENTILHSFKNKSIVKVGDWLQFAKDYKANPGLYKGESNSELMDKYVSLTANEYYRKRLQDFDLDFKNQLQEFKDGNMLFEIMERNVWTKASADTTGLRNFYHTHKAKYFWKESADAILFSAANENVANQASQRIKNLPNWHIAMDSNIVQLQTDSGRYELTQIPISAGVKAVEGMVTTPVVNTVDGTATFVKVVRLYPGNQQRTFEEARGLVINDYQVSVEDQWIAELKKNYPVKVNEAVFKSLIH